MSVVSEDDVEQAMLEWLVALGWSTAYGPDISPPDAKTPGTERATYRDVVLAERLRDAIARLNPQIPPGARVDALRRVLSPDVPGLVTANRQVHRWLVDGVPVEFQKDGETRGDRVRLLDFADAAANDWLAVNQFSVQGPKLTRRPDVVLFINGLPLVVVELKNPGDEDADIWAAWNQLQAYQQDIPDLFHANALQVVSDGIQARMGSLTAERERFMAWRTIDGVATDPLGPMRELETLVLGLFRRELLLEYLRHFVLFEDDGRLVKKVAGYHQFHAVRAVVQSVLHASAPGGSRKGGVVWHTQGAGKSIEMTCLAGALMAHPGMGNPTLLVVTDRNDLDNQLFGVFAGRERDVARDTGAGRDPPPSCAGCSPTGLRAASSSRPYRSSRRAWTRTAIRCSPTGTTSSSFATRRTAVSTASRLAWSAEPVRRPAGPPQTRLRCCSLPKARRHRICRQRPALAACAMATPSTCATRCLAPPSLPSQARLCR